MSRANEPAYPVAHVEDQQGLGSVLITEGGLTVREHFAGLAMQGLLAGDGRGGQSFPSLAMAAKAAVDAADALIAELEKAK